MPNINLEQFYKSIENIFNENELTPPNVIVTKTEDSKVVKTETIEPKTLSQIRHDEVLVSQSEKDINIDYYTNIYMKMIDLAEENNVNYMAAAVLFTSLLQRKGFMHDSICDILDKVSEERKSKAYYDYTLGIIYFNKAQQEGTMVFSCDLNSISVEVKPCEECYRKALQHFIDAMKKEYSTVEIIYLVAACFAALGDKESTIYMLKGADTIEPDFNTGYLREGLQTALKYLLNIYIIEDNYDKAFEISERLSKLLPLTLHSCILLNIVYLHHKKYHDAIRIWAFHRKIHPFDRIAVDFIGMNLFQLNKYYSASLYFAREIKLLNENPQGLPVDKNKRVLILMSYELSLGMWYWDNWHLDKAQQHFTSLAELVEINELEGYEPFTVLPCLIELDSYVDRLSKSLTCEEYFDLLGKSEELMVRALKKSSYYPDDIFKEGYDITAQTVYDIFNVEYPFNFLERLLRYKFIFLGILDVFSKKGDTLKEQMDGLSYIHKEMGLPEDKIISRELEYLNKIDYYIDNITNSFTEMGLQREAKSFESLKEFIRKLGYRSLYEVPKEEWDEIMCSLTTSVEPIMSKSMKESIKGFIFMTIEQANLNINIDQRSYTSSEKIAPAIERRDDKPELADLKINLEIDFSQKKKIFVNGKGFKMGERGPTQEFRILEELLNRGEIHWSSGFVLFEGWQAPDFVPERGPKWQFGNYVTRLNNILGPEAVESFTKGNAKLWRFRKSVDIVKNSIKQAEDICGKTGTMEDINRKIEKVQEALTLYPESIKTNSLLIDLLHEQNEPQNITGKLQQDLIFAVGRLRDREGKLSRAIRKIQAEGEKNDWGGEWEGVGSYAIEMAEKLKEIQLHKVIAEHLLKEVKLSDGEALCLAIAEMINEIKKADKTEPLKDTCFKVFIKIPLIAKCMKEAVKKVENKAIAMGLAEKSDFDAKTSVQLLAEGCLYDIIRDRTFDIINLDKLKNYLIVSMRPKLFARLIEVQCHISMSEQRLIRDVARIRNELYNKLHREPHSEEMIRKLGPSWDRDKLDEIYAYERQLKGFFEDPEKVLKELEDDQEDQPLENNGLLS